jgi:para-nitrobenzyl esterase
MPTARGLFHRAIAQSVPGTFLTPALSAAITARVADDLGRSPTVAELGQVDPVTLADTADLVGRRMRQYTDTWGTLAETTTPFSPVIDGHVLPTDPWTALRTGTAVKVPMIIGHTRDEFRIFTRGGGQIPAITEDQARHAVRLFAPNGDVDSYYRLLAESGIATDPTTVYETVNSDWLFRMPSARLAQANATAGAPTYLFELAYTVPQHGGILGAPHSADHPLVFGNFSGGVADRFYVQPVAADTQQLGDHMRRAWVDFARTGNPGWSAFTTGRTQTMIYDSDSHEQAYPHLLTLHAFGRHPVQVLDLVEQAGPDR